MSTISFFIPRMLSQYDEARVKFVFAKCLCIGTVNRVDFVPIEGESRFQQAFVHMEEIYNSPSNSHITEEVFDANRGVRMYPAMFNENEYWILLKNKNPVTETKLNIHQIVENARILQIVVDVQAEKIKILCEQMKKLTGIDIDVSTE
jgi:hypothetical protein